MQVHYVKPIVCGLALALWLLVWVVLAFRAARTGHRPPLSPGSAFTIFVVVMIVGFYLILRPDGRIDDVRVTELLIMLGSLFLALIASIAPAIVILRWLAPTSMPDEEQKRNLEIAREHIREYTEKWQERSAQRMVLWHVPSLIIGAIVIAALCVMVLARAFMR